MKAFKYVIWVILLFLVQTAVLHYIVPFGCRADLILPFVVVVAIKEDSFRTASVVSIVCAVMAGALCGKNFSFCVLFYTYIAAAAFMARRFFSYVPGLLHMYIWVLPASVLSEVISFLLLYSSTKWLHGAFINHMIPAAFFTQIGAAIVYLIASAVLFRRKRGRGLLISD